MGTEITRRSFMKASGTAVGVLLASAWSPFSYAQNEKLRVAVIGTGGQGNIHIRGGLAGTPEIEIVAICDLYAPHQNAGKMYAWISNAKIVNYNYGWTPPPQHIRNQIQAVLKPNAYYDYREMLVKETLDAVVIATPLDTHYQITMDCLDAGLFVFCEKTMCKTIEEARNVVTKCHDTGKFVQVGHQRRYNPEYNLAMRLAHDEGMIGRIHHIEMQWHRNHNWRRFVDPNYAMNEHEARLIPQYSKDFEQHMNWRIYEEKSLGLCSELFPHQSDVSNWFLGEMPRSIDATGGTDYWRDGRTTEDNIHVVMEYEMNRGDSGFHQISKRSSYQDMRAINKTYTVRVAYSSIMANASRGASELILGDDGTLQLSESNGCYLKRELHAIHQPVPITPNAPNTSQGMAQLVTGGYGTRMSTAPSEKGERLVAEGMEITPHMYQFRDFVRCIRNGTKPRTNEMCGLSTTILSALSFQSMREHRRIDVDPALMEFSFPTPGWTEYGAVNA